MKPSRPAAAMKVATSAGRIPIASSARAGAVRIPLAPAVRAAWTNCFAGFKVTNLGYGWDRTENVLWRLQHGELDGAYVDVVAMERILP